MARLFAGLITIMVLVFACNNKDSNALTAIQKATVNDSVIQMANQIATDVSKNGPTAWLAHFDDSSGFFMAVNGQLVFPNYDSASMFIKDRLIKLISKIELSWSDLRIDPLTPDLAMMAASYQEVLSDSAGQKRTELGYFTALAKKSSSGWKLRNCHWSSLDKKPS
jgi:hypothetical protein